MDGLSAGGNGCLNQQIYVKKWVAGAAINATEVDSFICILNMAG
jgi:hypothetical protein